MPPTLVEFLGQQGDKSALELRNHFDVPANHTVMTWDNHRWIRVRSMFAAFERMLADTLSACDNPENGDPSYEDWLQNLKGAPSRAPSYVATKGQIDAALKTLEVMRELKAIWDSSGTAAKKSPRPRPLLRPRPQI
jgi:hypothetical protein